MAAATIKAIEGRSVHQIQSGQVIVDLQSVCKELVENSIDAGATSIEVRFKNNGLDSIEVQDNGLGIAPADYDTLALKHYTSKLATYDDLSSLQTFGFRGEALSSLCALSHLHIVTARASDGPKGTKLEFEQSGKLKGTSVVAAKQGTTVVVDTLFYNLPVRRKELEKNIKREYNKVLQLLSAYACISVGVKFSVTNLMPKGKKTIAFSTNANSSTKDNISNVYGAKAMPALISLNLDFELDPSAQPGAAQDGKARRTQEDSGSRIVKIDGHISRPVVGEGRQTPDRQMFFVNSRPCNLPQVAKAFNEVYKSFNITQSPFVFADIKLDTNAYDVNVSPDKRTIMLHDQPSLLENLKNALYELFEGQNQSVPQGSLLGKKSVISSQRPAAVQPRLCPESTSDTECNVPRRTTVVPAAPVRSVEVDAPSNTPKSYSGFIKASLMERFAGPDAEEEDDNSPPMRRKRSISTILKKTNHHHRPIEIAQQRMVLSDADELDEHSRDSSPSSSLKLKQLAAADPILVSQPCDVEDHNAYLLSPQPHVRSPKTQLSILTTQEKDPAIPSVRPASLQGTPTNSIQNAFDRMRPTRTSTQQATITVGNTTMTSSIGTNGDMSAKKRTRITSSKSPMTSGSLNHIPKKHISKNSWGRFAAPGTQVEDTENGENEQLEEHGTGEVIGSSISHPNLQPINQSDSSENDTQLEDAPEVPETIACSDDEYIDEMEKKEQEEAKIAHMIAIAEESALRPTDLTLKRASKLFKVTPKRYWTINLEGTVETSIGLIRRQLECTQSTIQQSTVSNFEPSFTDLYGDLSQEDPEERLSLTVTKRDFYEMRIIGQFNLGFIIAVRPPTPISPTSDVFIIDQHASDEKYNFERLSASTTLVSQRLVHPHPLELTAVEEELILANKHALNANGFVIEMDLTHNNEHDEAGHRAKLTALPMSREVTFTLKDLEELLALILDNPPSSSTVSSPHIPRPSKVRKLLASRACRSSVMIGKTLQLARMREIVRHMGSMDKPWSCPHGRPTMRHLFGLEKWVGWREGDGVTGVDVLGEPTDWSGYLSSRHVEV